MSEQNVRTVQQIYAAFGRGDVPSILERVSEDTEWGFNAGASPVPWHGPFKGKADLPRFFQAMAENLDFHAFEPREFIAAGNDVISHVHLEYTIKKTNRKVNENSLLWWVFDPQGRVVRLTHYEDTAQVLAAYRG